MLTYDHKAKCIRYSATLRKSRNDVMIVDTALHVATSAAVMALALAMLPGLHMNRSKKAGLAVIFLLTLLDIAYDVVRLFLAFQPGVNYLIGFLEPALAVIVCALPVYGHAWSRATQWLGQRLSLASSAPSSGEAKLRHQRLTISSASDTLACQSGRGRFWSWLKGRVGGKRDITDQGTGEDAHLERHTIGSPTRLPKAFEGYPSSHSDASLIPVSDQEAVIAAYFHRTSDVV